MATTDPRIVVHPDYIIEERIVGNRPISRTSRDYTVVVVLNGICKVEITGSASEVNKDGIILLNPNQQCNLRSVGRSAKLLLVFLPATYVYQMAGQLQISSDSELLFRDILFEGNSRAAFLLETLSEEMSANQTGRSVVFDATISQLTVYLIRHLINVRRSLTVELSRVGVVDRRLRRAIEFMHLHSAEELSLSQIAASAFLSAYHFARLFKRITGQTPHAYLADIRVEQARQLLATSDLSINAIATKIGYESQSHFAKLFRSSTGLSPKQFRAASRPGDTNIE